jgi:hypothetical protein
MQARISNRGKQNTHVTCLSYIACKIMAQLLPDSRGRDWHGLEQLLHWSDWRRRHQFLARICHFRTQQILLFAH